MLAEKTEKILHGVYDLSIEEYHNGPGISRSSLVEFQKSPLHFWYNETNKEPEELSKIIRVSNALEFGNALHTFILGPADFDNRYLSMPKVSLATKEGKRVYEELLAEAGARALICEEAMKVIRDMSQSIHSNEDARELILGALYEKSIYWTDQDSQLLCKTRPDIWHSNFICDLKTCNSASLKDFERSVYSYGYHIQAAMIQEAIMNVQGNKIKNFVYVAIEKEPPYAVAVYKLDELAVDLGLMQFKAILMGIRKCLNDNHWPSYPSGLITVPAWMLK